MVHEVNFERKLFGSKVAIALYDVDEDAAQDVLSDAYKEALRLQKIFNLYDEESELSHLNSSRDLRVSDELVEVIRYALELCEKTKGAYDITLGKQILQRKKGLAVEKVGCTYKDVSVEKNRIILKHPDIIIDLGSIAKGYIGDRIADYLKEVGILDGMVDARGDIVFFGDYVHKIQVQHPRKEEGICTLQLKDTSVATSGDYMQFANTHEASHILHQKELISITVVAKTLLEADAYATVLFVVDEVTRKILLDENKKIRVLTIDKKLNMKTFNGFKELMVI